jgi:Ser/Thr protein kinase RdoA (MazF antagonist)
MMQMDLKKYIDKNRDTFELISGEGTNKVYRFNAGNTNYILKICKMNKNNLSPFWLNMKKLFGYDFSLHTKNMNVLYKKLRNKYIAVSKPVCLDPARNMQVFKEIGGKKYAPDIFPENENIHFALGKYIGRIHRTTYKNYGGAAVQNKPKEHFKDNMTEILEWTIKNYWEGNGDVLAQFAKIKETKFETSGFSLIMPDISGNQFVYSADLQNINGLVDLDAYVVGPKEYELSVIEMCMPDNNCAECFVKGYERENTFPGIGRTRNMYRLFSYLCDPGAKEKLESFMHKKIYFR